MPPITKDSDTLSTQETSSRSGSLASLDSATRTQPVPLEIPITVNGARTADGSDKREPFSESTKTVMIHGNGAVIKLNSALAPGQLLFLTNERTKKEVVCQVVKSKNCRNVSGYVELEFTEPAVGFWGMRFSAERIPPGGPSAPEASRPAAPPGRVVPKVEEPAEESVRRKPSTSAPVLPAPAAPLPSVFVSEEPLVEPWLKKREPASPAEPPGLARPEPVRKTEAPATNQTPVHNFELARPSDRPASLFAPSEPPSNPATVDLSSLAPFFEVKTAPHDAARRERPQEPGPSDLETEELKRHTTRLEEELSQLRFAEPGAPQAKPAAAAPPVPADEPAISLPKAEPVHEKAAELLESPAESSAPSTLPEVRKLEEPLKIEPPVSIPALSPLEEEELKIPAWLAPLAQHASAPSSTKEPVLGEKAKRTAEQPPLEELMAPLAAPVKEEKAAASRVPQFGSALPFEGARRIKESAPTKPGKGMLLAALAAGTLVAAGGWWYKNQPSGGVQVGPSAQQAPAAQTTPGEVETNSPKGAELETILPVPKDLAAPAEPKAGSSNVPAKAAPETPAPPRSPRSASNFANGGTAVVVAETVEREAARTEKKPVLGEVRLEAPKISPKRTAKNGLEPEAGISLDGEPPVGNGNVLGAELGASGKQPSAPAAPLPVGGEVRQARLVHSVPPDYPAFARAQHISGGVTIDALIDASGRVTKMKVLSGPPLLERAAMDALRQWKYEPAQLDGKAVPMHLTVTLQFHLEQ